VANVGAFRAGGTERRGEVELVAAKLGAVEIARDHVEPGYRPDARRAPTLTAGGYLAAVDDLGSPAYSPSRIAASPEPVRAASDAALRDAEALTLAPAPPSRATGCSSGTAGRPVEVAIPPNGLLITSTGESAAGVAVRRFAAAYTPLRGSVAASTTALLRPPPDPEPRPWHARITSGGDVRACPAG
jgi:hypothetical protein